MHQLVDFAETLVHIQAHCSVTLLSHAGQGGKNATVKAVGRLYRAAIVLGMLVLGPWLKRVCADEVCCKINVADLAKLRFLCGGRHCSLCAEVNACLVSLVKSFAFLTSLYCEFLLLYIAFPAHWGTANGMLSCFRTLSLFVLCKY